MNPNDITQIVQDAVQRGHDMGFEYGWNCALLKAQMLVINELPYPQCMELAAKVLALQPERKP
jgi:hypothetical protein